MLYVLGGGTTEELAFPEGMVEAIGNISTGVTVQTNSGSTRLGSNGTVTVSTVGFKPDLVTFYCEAWTDSGTKIDSMVCACWTDPNMSYDATVNSGYCAYLGIAVDYYVTRSNTGFTVEIGQWTSDDTSWSANTSRPTVKWYAVKYTE